MAVDPDYEKWAAQHAFAGAQSVQVLEFQHDDWPESEWLTDFGAGFNGMTETGTPFSARAVALTVERPNASTSTQQELTVKLDALGGAVMGRIRAMTDAQRDKPITLIWRVYLDLKPNAPAMDPLDFLVLDVQATRLVVELRCAATILPNVAAGIRYTVDKFPSLAFL